MVVYSCFVINRAGSLLFYGHYGDHARLLPNEQLRLASTFHGLSAIAGQLSPAADNSGIGTLDTDTFRLHSFKTLTGLNFVVMADLQQQNIDALLKKMYAIYADFALKNPFYHVDMPIRCELFEQHMQQSVEQTERNLWRVAPAAGAAVKA